MVRLLPWEYGVRNLLRRPARSLLTLLALMLVVLMILIVIGFLRGLETSLAISGNADVAYLTSLGSSENVEISSVAGNTADIVTSNVAAIKRRSGPGGVPIAYASPELYLGTQVAIGTGEPSLGLVRGVTPSALLVRRQVQMLEGRWPGPGEVIVGRLAGTKLGVGPEGLTVDERLTFEGRTWRISGRFAAQGSGIEAEIWCLLDDLQGLLKRQDLSIVAVTLASGTSFGDLDDFCKERIDLELEATPETAYYEALSKHYAPVRGLAWLLVALLAGSGVLAGLNALYGAVANRVRELATLQTLGFQRRAIALGLIQEGVLLAACASLIAAVLALTLVHGLAIRFTMGAFTLRVDSVCLLWGLGVGLGLGIFGALPPALKAMRLPIAEGLKSVG